MATRSATRTIRSSDGTQIGVHSVGSGPPVVLVHGAWNWAEHWMGVAEELADTFTCLMMDRRGERHRGTRAPPYDGHAHQAHRTDPSLVANEVRSFLLAGST